MASMSLSPVNPASSSQDTEPVSSPKQPTARISHQVWKRSSPEHATHNLDEQALNPGPEGPGSEWPDDPDHPEANTVVLQPPEQTALPPLAGGTISTSGTIGLGILSGTIAVARGVGAQRILYKDEHSARPPPDTPPTLGIGPLPATEEPPAPSLADDLPPRPSPERFPMPGSDRSPPPVTPQPAPSPQPAPLPSPAPASPSTGMGPEAPPPSAPSTDTAAHHLTTPPADPGSMRPVPAPEPAPAPDTAPVQVPSPAPLPEPPAPPPEPPKYPDQQPIQPFGYGQTQALPKSLFTGLTEKDSPGFIWILTIEPESPDDDTQPVLILSPGTPEARILKAGDVVPAEQFDQLYWDGSHNTGGRFSFVALDQKKTPFEQIGPQEIVLKQDAFPPTPAYPANQAPHPVAHDAELRIASISFRGTVAEQAPDAIRITRIAALEPTDPDASALMLHLEDGSRHPLREGDLIRAEDFGRVHWHTLHNAGGAFDFIPLTAQHVPIRAAGTQTIQIHEHPSPPAYADSIATIGVAHEQSRLLDPALFRGSDPSREPAGIRITAINVLNTEADRQPALLFGEQQIPVSAGFFIRAEEFDQLRWSVVGNQGGSFDFEAANADGTPILGSPTQHVPIHESPPPPDYSAETRLRFRHDANPKLPANWFDGDDPENKPAHILITDIKAGELSPDRGSPLFYQWHGQRIDVNIGDRVPAMFFSHLTWDAKITNGGHISFVPLDDQQRVIEGASPRTLTLMEYSPVPGYGTGYPSLVPVGHDRLTHLPEEVFAGNVPAQRPPAVQILSLDPPNGTGAPESASLWLDPDGPEGPTAPSAVQPGQIIRSAQYDQLYWDSRHHQGRGRLHFRPLNSDDTTIAGAVQPNVYMHETPTPAIYSQTDFTLPTAHDRMFAVDLRPLYPQNDLSKYPYLRILSVEATNSTGADTPVAYSGGHSGTPQPLKVGDDFNLSSGGNYLVWDSRSNAGGRMTLEILDYFHQPVIGSPTLSLSLVESPPPPVYEPERHNRNQLPLARWINDNRVDIDPTIFTGENPDLAPAYIQITSVNFRFTQISPLALHLGQPNEQLLKAGSIIARSDFAHVSWNGKTNLGGDFSFIPLDENQLPYAGPIRQYATIFPVFSRPVYHNTTPELTVGHDQTLHFERSLFQGDGASHEYPKYIRITALNPTAPAEGSNALMIDTDGPGGNAPRALQVGDFVLSNQFDKLSWQTNGNEGGSFSFRVYEIDWNTRMHPTAPEITVTVREEAPAGQGQAGTDVNAVTKAIDEPSPTAEGETITENITGHEHLLSGEPDSHALIRNLTPLTEIGPPIF